jgi:predicted CoA-substrate-specific enzyme activase
MIAGGCDIGSTTSKAVIFKDGEIVSYYIMDSTVNPYESSKMAMNEALKLAGLNSIEDLDYIVGTGYGRLKVLFADENVSEITCHGRGAHFLCPTVKTIVDIGGQDAKVISISDKGKVLEFVMNERCAAGTGKFFEAMAKTLQCGLDGISSPSNQGENPSIITSQCSVFAESEVVTLISEGNELKNIISGVNFSVASRLNSLTRKIGIEEDITLTGGCSKNQGLTMALESKLGIKMKKLSVDAQLAGALGAAVIATEKANGKRKV